MPVHHSWWFFSPYLDVNPTNIHHDSRGYKYTLFGRKTDSLRLSVVKDQSLRPIVSSIVGGMAFNSSFANYGHPPNYGCPTSVASPESNCWGEATVFCGLQAPGATAGEPSHSGTSQLKLSSQGRPAPDSGQNLVVLWFLKQELAN